MFRLPAHFQIATCRWIGLLAAALNVQCGRPVFAAPLTADEVMAAIDQLGSDSLLERRRAEVRLLEAGPSLLDRLPAPEELSDVAQQQAVRRIQQELERTLARQAGQPTHVTVRGRKSLAELLTEIERQTGNRLQAEPALHDEFPQLLHIDWNQSTFWQAANELAERCRLELCDGREEGTVKLQKPGADVPMTASFARRSRCDASTPFLICVQSSKSAVPQPASGRNWLRLRVEVWAEPRLRPVFLTCRDQDLSVRVDGRELTPLNPLAVREVEFTDAGRAVFDVTFEGPIGTEMPRFEIQGDLEVELVALTRELQFRQLDARLPDVQRRGNVTVTLESIRPAGAGDSAEVQFTLRYAAGGPSFESHRIGSLLASADLLLPDGARQRSAGVPELTREQDGAIGVRCRFESLPENWREGTLIYVVPATILRAPVAFSVADE